MKPDGQPCPSCGPAPSGFSPVRSSPRERGYDSAWDEYSRDYRLRNPYCVACEAAGIVSPACVVDHITPFRRPDGSIDEQLRKDPANHQSLCDHRHRDCANRLKLPLERKFAHDPGRIHEEWFRLLERLRHEQVEVTS